MPSKPSPNGSDGRDSQGKFTRGNSLGRGNPYAQKTAQLRAALLNAVEPGDVEAVIRTLVDQAKSGDVVAAREFLLRVLGKPIESDLLERLEALEEAMNTKARTTP